MKLWLFVLAALFLFCGCSDKDENGVDSQPTIEPVITSAPTESTAVLASRIPVETATAENVPETFTLDENNSEIRLAIEPEIVSEDIEALEVTILAIDNEALTGFSVFASLEWVTVGLGDGNVRLGAFSVFPADQPGRYTLSVRDGLTILREAVLEDEISDLILILRIEPVSTAGNLAGVKVHFAPPVWQ